MVGARAAGFCVSQSARRAVTNSTASNGELLPQHARALPKQRGAARNGGAGRAAGVHKARMQLRRGRLQCSE